MGRFPAAVLLLVALPSLARAQGGLGSVDRRVDPARQVVVIVNEAVPDSVAVGLHYCRRRSIPEANLCRVRTTDREVLSWPEFREQVQKPVTRFLEKFPDALFLVPCWGIPSRISEENAENDDPKDEPESTVRTFVTNRDYACLDAELALLPRPARAIEGWIESDLYGRNERITAAHRLFLVSRLDGLTAGIARGLVDKAIHAETFGPAGEAYLDTRGLDKASPYGYTDEEMRLTLQVFAAYGWAIHHEDTEEEQDVSSLKNCLFYWGWYAGDWNGRQPFTFRTGAVAAHLHSCAACSIRTETRFWVGPLLSHGVTCTTGTVYEPLTAGFPRMHLIYDRLFQGYTWGEATAMGNQMLSWMAVFVGDPLYAPFAKGLRETQAANRDLATAGPRKAEMLLDSGDLDGAAAILRDIRALPAAFEEAADPAFLLRELAARRLQPASGTVDSVRTACAEGRAAALNADTKAATAAFERALKLSPLNFDANLSLGLFLLDADRAAQALPFFDKCARVDPADPALQVPWGIALGASGKFKEAIPILENAVAGGDPGGLGALGDCYLRAGDRPRAIATLKDAVARFPKDRKAWASLARAHRDSGDDAAAHAVLMEAVQIYPESVLDIAAYRTLWKDANVAAERAKLKKEREDIIWVLKDFDLPDFAPPTQGVWLEINRQADAARAEAGALVLGSIQEQALKVPGLPRLQCGNLSPSPIVLYLKGPCSRVVRFPAFAGQKGASREVGIWPGEYDVVLVVQKGGEKTTIVGTTTFHLHKEYGMTVSPGLGLEFPQR
ncbi:MAG: TIGR03790 family protein [Candidatus Brocadiae bacterium]|nr:TIGR03790 family protein [Candidatus Brocadiia bacterium]